MGVGSSGYTAAEGSLGTTPGLPNPPHPHPTLTLQPWLPALQKSELDPTGASWTLFLLARGSVKTIGTVGAEVGRDPCPHTCRCGQPLRVSFVGGSACRHLPWLPLDAMGTQASTGPGVSFVAGLSGDSQASFCVCSHPRPHTYTPFSLV